MSQRLHIGPTTERFYDCVIESFNDDDDCERQLLRAIGFYMKIRIGDMQLFRTIEPKLKAIFETLNREYPDDVWAFYYKDESIEHPTVDELNDWLKAVRVK